MGSLLSKDPFFSNIYPLQMVLRLLATVIMFLVLHQCVEYTVWSFEVNEPPCISFNLCVVCMCVCVGGGGGGGEGMWILI